LTILKTGSIAMVGLCDLQR